MTQRSSATPSASTAQWFQPTAGSPRAASPTDRSGSVRRSTRAALPATPAASSTLARPDSFGATSASSARRGSGAGLTVDRAPEGQAASTSRSSMPDRWFGRPGLSLEDRLTRSSAARGHAYPSSSAPTARAFVLDASPAAQPAVTRSRDPSASGPGAPSPRLQRQIARVEAKSNVLWEGSLARPTRPARVDATVSGWARARGTKSVVEAAALQPRGPETAYDALRKHGNPTDGTPFWPVWARRLRPEDELRIVSDDPPPVVVRRLPRPRRAHGWDRSRPRLRRVDAVIGGVQSEAVLDLSAQDQGQPSARAGTRGQNRSCPRCGGPRPAPRRHPRTLARSPPPRTRPA